MTTCSYHLDTSSVGKSPVAIFVCVAKLRTKLLHMITCAILTISKSISVHFHCPTPCVTCGKMYKRSSTHYTCIANHRDQQCLELYHSRPFMDSHPEYNSMYCKQTFNCMMAVKVIHTYYCQSNYIYNE